MNATECPYTAKEFEQLTEKERGVLQRVANYRGIDLASEDTPLGDETIEGAFNLFRPCGGCVPEEEIGDDLCLTVREKFACVYGPAIDADPQMKLKNPCTAARSLSVKMSPRIVRTTGMMPPAPSPCRPRNRMS